MCWSLYIRKMIIEEDGIRTIFQKKWGMCSRKAFRRAQQQQFVTKWFGFNNKSR
jgi:hypothetical protein